METVQVQQITDFGTRRRGSNANTYQQKAYPHQINKIMNKKVIDVHVEKMIPGTCTICNKYVGKGLYNHKLRCEREHQGK